MKTMENELSQIVLKKRIKWLIWFFIFGLLISGATAIPLETELKLTANWLPEGSALEKWITRIRDALIDTNSRYPFLAYGTDWLAFAHFAIAVAFIGPLRDPVKNIWVIEFGMIACVMIVPYALIMGAVRNIPVFWRLIDCSFGIFGIVPLWYCRRSIQALNKA